MSKLTHLLIEINANLFQDLLNHLITFFLNAHVHGVVDGIVHHLLPLLHDVVLAFKLHGYPLELREVH